MLNEFASIAFFHGDQDVAMKYMKKVESLLVDLKEVEDGMQRSCCYYFVNVILLFMTFLTVFL